MTSKCCRPLIDELTSAYAVTDDKYVAEEFAEKVPEERRVQGRGIEVGHIFYFGTKYSEPMNAKVQGPDGQQHDVHMGSYGIGVSRLVGAIIEANHDDHGIIWPNAVAPFKVGMLDLKPGHQGTASILSQLRGQFEQMGVTYLIDDTHERAGAKFAAMDLIGVPFQIITGPKLADRQLVEFKVRRTGARHEISVHEAVRLVAEGLAS
jgi:Prolyl-tRNA synthetase